MSHSHANMLPRGALVVVGTMVGFALLATTAVRVTGTPPAALPAAVRAEAGTTMVASRTLRFIDRADGAVVIEDVGHGGTAGIIDAGQETGFIRGVMRGLARERRGQGIGNGPPFMLTAWSDGQLTLTDSATGRSIEMTAFGSTNRASFAALLAPRA